MADEVPGTVGWVDITVDHAEGLRDFYAQVVGWQPQGLDMGGYEDFNMTDPVEGVPRAGVCHARGMNADLPPVWMVYFRVADLDAALVAVGERGGSLLSEPRSAGGTRYAMIRDPAGAVCALAGP